MARQDMSDDASELYISMDNDSSIYNQRVSCIKNLCRKISQGKFEFDKSVVLWMYWVENGAKSYHRQHGSKDFPWHMMFPKNVRQEVAHAFALDFIAEYDANQWDGINPVKPERRPETVADGSAEGDGGYYEDEVYTD